MNVTETGPGELRVFKMMSKLMDARLWGWCRTGRSGGQQAAGLGESKQPPGRSKGAVCVSCSVVSDSAAPYTVAHQVPLSMGFSRQEHWSGLPFPSPKGTIDPGY